MTDPFILTGRWVIESADQIHENAGVLIKEGHVVEIGAKDDLRRRYEGVQEFGGSDFAVLPGFVNAHHHCYGVELSNQAVADDFLEPWMFAGFGMSAITQRLSTLYSAVRLLKSGVTSVVDMCSAGPNRDAAVTAVSEKADAYRQAGIRAAIAPGERWQNRMIHADGEDLPFFDSLPGELQARVLLVQARRKRLSPEDYVSVMSWLAKEFARDELISVWFGPTAPQWTPEHVMRDIVEEAERSDTRIQTHVLESYYESLESPRSRSKRVLPFLNDIGLLSERTSMAHMVWADPRDFDLIANSGAQISCNPSSNLRLRSGIAPAASYRDAGIPVAIGMDGTTLADDEDMFAEMRLALNLNRPPHPKGVALTIKDVFSMATSGGAVLLGRRNDLGQLTPGFRADAVLVDTKRMTTPWIDPDADPLTLLLTRARRDDVRHVFVDGRQALKDGRVLNVDEGSLHEEIADALLASKSKTEERSLCRDLRPYLLDWYSRWDDAVTQNNEPVYAYGRDLSDLPF
ncbi:amidohydrolase family protein [Roseibium sp. SCP14]|uniref:amidohydrolase family protein n=1 Tax=Roseibium sp. SCP14 TaxID=3141375 RepID=UPI003336753B